MPVRVNNVWKNGSVCLKLGMNVMPLDAIPPMYVLISNINIANLWTFAENPALDSLI